jgi:hypothetical protein
MTLSSQNDERLSSLMREVRRAAPAEILLSAQCIGTVAGGSLRRTMLPALVVALVAVLIIIIIVISRRCERKGTQEGFPPVQNAMGYRIALPGDPYENVLRRSTPLPPRQRRVGGLADFYFNYDPANATWFGGDYCDRSPSACGGFAIEPFRAF